MKKGKRKLELKANIITDESNVCVKTKKRQLKHLKKIIKIKTLLSVQLFLEVIEISNRHIWSFF